MTSFHTPSSRPVGSSSPPVLRARISLQAFTDFLLPSAQPGWPLRDFTGMPEDGGARFATALVVLLRYQRQGQQAVGICLGDLPTHPEQPPAEQAENPRCFQPVLLNALDHLSQTHIVSYMLYLLQERPQNKSDRLRAIRAANDKLRQGMTAAESLKNRTQDPESRKSLDTLRLYFRSTILRLEELREQEMHSFDGYELLCQAEEQLRGQVVPGMAVLETEMRRVEVR
ncbi:hypothetical protein JCM8547_002151 [Rhodosporidiobolus lusitaniae]